MESTFDLLSIKLIEQAKDKHIPILGALELTGRCNLNCKMCYVHDSCYESHYREGELNASQWIKLASQARDAGLLFLILTGGEVFLRPDFKNIYENLAHMGFNLTIYTNASLVTKETAQWLGRIPPSEITVTIYGASPETYFKVCGNADAYAATVKGIDLLLAEGMNVDIRTTMIKENANDYEKLAEFAHKRGIEISVVNYVAPARSKPASVQSSRLSPEEFKAFGLQSLQINEKLINKETGFGISEELLQCRGKLINELIEMKDSNVDKAVSAFACSAGKCDFWVSWDGRMVPCGMLDEPMVYPLETGFTNAWKALLQMCDTIPSCIECNQCSYREYCMTCPARLKQETGYFDKPARYLCGLAEQVKKHIELQDSII